MRNVTCGNCGTKHYSGTTHCEKCSYELYGVGHKKRMGFEMDRIRFFGF